MTSWILGNNKTQIWGAKDELNACTCDEKGDEVCAPILEVVEPYNCVF
jgi:hypothetical protein